MTLLAGGTSIQHGDRQAPARSGGVGVSHGEVLQGFTGRPCTHHRGKTWHQTLQLYPWCGRGLSVTAIP